MARRKKRHRRYFGFSRRRGRRHRGGMTIPIAPLAGAAAMFVAPCPSGRTLLSDVTSGNLEEFAYDAKERFTCVDSNGTFRPEWLLSSYGPVIAGVLVHKFVGGKPLNVNGMLARAKIPFVRL